jgi:hypothetical protein
MILRRLALLLLFCLGTALAATAAQWRNQLQTRPGNHPLPRPLTATYDFGWSGLKAADATARFTRQKDQLKLELTARTSGLARALWRMDSHGVSTVNAKTLRPIKLVQTETYARKSVDTTVDFTPVGPRRTRLITPPDPVPPKPKTFKVSQSHDLHSALLFVRSQRLAKGDTFRICVFPGSSPYLADITAGEPETVKAAGKEWAAIPCDLKLREIEKDMSLMPHPKFKGAKVWLSNDADRLLLRIEADVHVGSIFAELREVTFAEPAAGKR